MPSHKIDHYDSHIFDTILVNMFGVIMVIS